MDLWQIAGQVPLVLEGKEEALALVERHNRVEDRVLVVDVAVDVDGQLHVGSEVVGHPAAFHDPVEAVVDQPVEEWEVLVAPGIVG